MREADFRKLAAELATRRLAGAEEQEKPQEQALAILDAAVIKALADSPDAAPAHATLRAFLAAEPRLGESYGLMQISGGTRPVFALAASFSQAGPSAVRIYAPAPGSAAGYRLAGRIDRFTFGEFFDEFMEVVPVHAGAAVFVTVTGRTDERKTGMFAAWRFDGSRVVSLAWDDVLEQSSYEVKGSEFRVQYCAEPDEERPRVCRKTLLDRYGWSGLWVRLSRDEVSTPPRTP